jgi:hypothetical protein
MHHYPCFACHRHLRDSDRICPFCGAIQSTVSPSSAMGAVALAVTLLGSSACSRDPGTDDSTAGTTTSMTSMTTETDTTTGSESDTNLTTVGDGDGDTAEDDTNTAGSFYAGPTDLPNIPECDPFAQDCPDGEKCVPYSPNGGWFEANKCVPVVGDGQPGDPCEYSGTTESIDDCGPNSFCWPGNHICTEFCQGTADEPTCPMDIVCLIEGNGSVNLCLTVCDPLLQDCQPGFACHWIDDEFRCTPPGEADIAEPCDANQDCAPGLTCAPADSLPNCADDSCCTALCDLSALECVEMGTECVPFFDGMPPPGHDDVGICLVP